MNRLPRALKEGRPQAKLYRYRPSLSLARGGSLRENEGMEEDEAKERRRNTFLLLRFAPRLALLMGMVFTANHFAPQHLPLPVALGIFAVFYAGLFVLMGLDVYRHRNDA